MPANYTNNEFMRMREQAIMRAREMQRQAAIKDNAPHQSQTIEEQNPDEPKPQENEFSEHDNSLRFEKHSDSEDFPHHNSSHFNSPRSKKTPKQHHKIQPQDDDRMLIMTLLLILIADGADRMLIFALMYIMM